VKLGRSETARIKPFPVTLHLLIASCLPLFSTSIPHRTRCAMKLSLEMHSRSLPLSVTPRYFWVVCDFLCVLKEVRTCAMV
jgi:hypothetical protein